MSKEDQINISEEALKWVKKNKGFQVNEKGAYTSPRISSEIADCSMCLTFDQYSYCSLGCLYCFAYFFKSNNPAMKEGIGLKQIKLSTLISTMQGTETNKTLKAYYEHFYKKKFVLHWGGVR